VQGSGEAGLDVIESRDRQYKHRYTSSSVHQPVNITVILTGQHYYAPPLRAALSDDARLTTSVVCLTSVAYIVNIHGAHSYWKQGALDAAGVRDWLQLGRSVRRTAGGAYCVATRISCYGNIDRSILSQYCLVGNGGCSHNELGVLCSQALAVL